ncbi:hypothetical protein [Streptomyces sp. SID5643]|uniref:hypothetical protein n=1 Tax=Streptomyces sp. SID5643 TaxID=2690307 RepID=UPI00136AAADB|nr:hypothetical protein [Streptomyces sp. SID5643]MZF90632.1 hypothetical protein [Streptomyces sp. SID5643]
MEGTVHRLRGGAGHPVAALDFAFEAGAAAAARDMYGPHAAHHTAAPSRLFARGPGHAEEILTV